MKELVSAAKEINKILQECEDEGLGYDATLAKISVVKVHGVIFPTLMLMEIIDEFVKGYAERQKKIVNDDSNEIQEKYEEYSKKWNMKDLN
tara:strand:- start:1041 stop:1313 length:273 start_codon:yes stop_codon:yes gene_type:complete